MENYKIIRKQKPVLVGRKLKRIGEVYYEIAIWDGMNWFYLKDEPKTEKEAKEIVRLRFGF